MPTLAILVLYGSSLFFIFQRTYLLYSRSKSNPVDCEPLPSYPHLDPIWGIDLLIQIWREFRRGALSEGMRKRHEKYGKTFNTVNVGQHCIYTMDPENIRAVTTGNFEHYGKSSWVQEASKHIGQGILMNEGEAWKRSRDMLKPLFSRSSVDEAALVEPHMQQLIKVIRKNGKRPFDFRELSERFILDVVTDFLFGKSTGCLSASTDDDESRRFLSFVKTFEPPSGMFMAVGILAWIELIPSYQQLIQTVNGMKRFFKRQLDMVTLDSELHMHKSGISCFRMMKNDGVPISQIQGEIQNIFFASFDTTSALLTNIVFILSRRQDIQQQLRQEISYLKRKPPTRQDLAGMRFLGYVIQEALRLYTPVASHSRRAIKNTTLPRGGGIDGKSPVFVPVGATVMWSIYSLNRSPAYYGGDWSEFRPERWENLQRNCNQFFMPFGSGPRACMGQQMVQVEIAYMLVRLLQEFSVIENEDPQPFREARGVSFYNSRGALVSMR